MKQKKKVEEVEPIIFEDCYTVFAADLSMKCPGFAEINVRNKQIESVITWSVDNKKSYKKSHPQILQEIAESMYEKIIDITDWNDRRQMFFVREKAINTLDTRAVMAIHKVVGLTDYLAYTECNNALWYEIFPVTVKKLMTGNCKADKQLVAEAVKRYVGNRDFPNDDESDSCAVGLAWLIQQGQLETIGEQQL